METIYISIQVEPTETPREGWSDLDKTLTSPLFRKLSSAKIVVEKWVFQEPDHNTSMRRLSAESMQSLLPRLHEGNILEVHDYEDEWNVRCAFSLDYQEIRRSVTSF